MQGRGNRPAFAENFSRRNRIPPCRGVLDQETLP